MLFGTVIVALGFILLSRINSLVQFYLIFIGLVTVGRSLSSMIPIDTTVANWFIRRRGTAFGLLRAAVAVGAAGVIFVSWFIGEFGWRHRHLGYRDTHCSCYETPSGALRNAPGR